MVTWVKQYFAGLQSLMRALPKFAGVTITFRSDMSFLDQVAPAIALARFFGVRTTLRYHSNKAEVELEDYGRGMLPFLKICDRITVNCDYLAKVFRGYGLTAEVRTPSVDTVKFKARQIKAVQPKILVARRHVRGNGLTGAIKAFELIKWKYPRAEMIILGDGPLRPWLEEFTERERIDGVTFAGPVDQAAVAKHMKEADVYINNATMDGLSQSMLEAMACGLCVISTDIGDAPKVIRHGDNGLLTPVNDHVALADRVFELIEIDGLAAKLSAKVPQAIGGTTEQR